ncbi:MAG: sigma-70 family RNA polymerase sigma factor [Verrucomicrobiaceae bacterium]|nr:MAG: sigma-70 family RNA polymerase sigma factor [Verrucomicrobiaceae bacterium]
MESDTDLLHRFATKGEEAAFSQLVARHAGMMQGVAFRCTGDHALAEDVTQAVFVILMKKARALRHECVVGWLHRTTFLEARNAGRKAARYRRTLSRFGSLFSPSPAPASMTEDEILPHLDEALIRLPARNRQLVVLRFYESKSVSEIAAATGTNEEACKKQIQRSVHRLGDLLRRRGVFTTSGSLASLLAGQAFLVPPSSAAVLVAASAHAPSSLLPFYLSFMNTNAILKASAVVLVLAAIPATVLWQKDKTPAAEPEPASVLAREKSQPSAQVQPSGQAPVKSMSAKRPTPVSDPMDERLGATPSDFAAKIRSVLKGEVSEDEQLAFWQAVKAGGRLDELIDELKASNSDSPGDVQSRLDLGLAYVAKIWSMPDGPEKAIWAGKAEGVWKEVLAVEPSNWEAQRNIAFSYSRYPEFLNKTSDAISAYENTLTLQESSPQPRKEYADSYLELARLQVRIGDPGSALSTLQRGAAAHPDSTSIAKQLDVIKSSYKFDAAQ